MQRTGSRKQHLVQVCCQPEARRILHRIQRASLLVGKRLHTPKVKESRSCWSAAAESNARDSTIGSHFHRHNVGMHLRSGIHTIEKLLAQTIRSRRAGETFIQQDRMVRNRLIQFGELPGSGRP